MTLKTEDGLDTGHTPVLVKHEVLKGARPDGALIIETHYTCTICRTRVRVRESDGVPESYALYIFGKDDETSYKRRSIKRLPKCMLLLYGHHLRAVREFDPVKRADFHKLSLGMSRV